MSLGPQCIACRRRRIRCDSLLPCTKCAKAKIDCPGYGKRLTWVGGSKASRRLPLSSEPNTLKPQSTGKTSGEGRNSSTYSSRISSKSENLTLAFPLALNPDDSLLLESIQYFNTVICPDLLPIKSDPNLYQIPSKAWQSYPGLLRYLVVCIAQANKDFRISQNSNQTLGPSKLVLDYKSRALRALNKRMEVPATATDDTTLLAVLMILMAEIQTASAQIWLTHLEGARQLLKLKGGFFACFQKTPGARNLLYSFMMVDVMSSTTCNSSLVASENFIHDQFEYTEWLPKFYEDYDSMSYCPCPMEIMQAIILTNVRRAAIALISMRSMIGSAAFPGQDFSHIPLPEAEDIITQFLQFSPETWAECCKRRWTQRQSEFKNLYGIALEDTCNDINWASIGRCYKWAGLIYCLHTLRHVHDVKMCTIKPGLPEDGSRGQISSSVFEMKERARIELVSELRAFSAQSIHKVVLWPLVVAGFAILACDDIDETAFSFISSSIGRLSRLLGAETMEVADKLLRCAKATLISSNSHEQTWSTWVNDNVLWDRIFCERRVFIL